MRRGAFGSIVVVVACFIVDSSGSAQLQSRLQATFKPPLQLLERPSEPVAKFTPDPPNGVGEFGVAVDMTPGRIVAGSPFDDELASDCGAAFVYELVGGKWRRIQKLLPPTGNAQDYFGVDVAIDDDVIVVGAQATDIQGLNSGSAYVYEWTGESWTFAVQLRASDQGSGITAFGSSVAISGNTIVVGSAFGSGNCSPGQDCGAAYVYVRPGAAWRDATGPLYESTRLQAFVGVPSEKLGHPVAIDKDVVVVGASSSIAGGAAYVFEKPSGGWDSQATVTQSARITAAHQSEAFGIRLDVQMNDTEGDLVVIGAWSEDTEFGINSGAAYLIREPATGWANQVAQLNLMGSDVSAGDFYGTAISISGNRVTVGANQDDPQVLAGSPESGRLYLFEVVGSQAVQVQTFQIASIDVPGSVYHAGFGYAATLSRNTLAVSAITEDNIKGTDAGAVYVFDLPMPD